MLTRYKIYLLSLLTKLNALNISENPLCDLDPIANLKDLTSLYLWHTNIRDITCLKSNTKLVELGLADNQINDVRGLFDLKHLDLLFLGGNENIPENQLQEIEAKNLSDFRRPDWKKQIEN